MKAPIHRVDLESVSLAATGDTVPILIVDDNAGRRLALRAVLTPLGYHIIEADSGLASLRCVMAQDFAVILMDVRMPIMDGFETAHLIRQRHRSGLTPIIFITAHGSESMTNNTAYATGAADFIFGPVPPAELRAKVTVFANLYLRAQYLATRAQELQESADQLTLLTDCAPIGIFRTDADNNYVYTNPRWSEITGISFEEALQRPWNIIIPEHAAPALPGAPTDGSLADRLSRRFDISPPNEPGVRVVEWTSTLVKAGNGTNLGWVGTLADVTAEAAATAAMEAARDTALTATRMQRDFAASASHELKTPTASVVGFVEEVLDNNELSDVDRKHLDIAYRSAQRLSRLIDDLLMLGEADVALGATHFEPTEVIQLIQLAVSPFTGTALQSNVDLSIGPTRSLYALADPLRLEQALTNLISNALKFTPPGGAIRITAHREQDTVQIDVSDTGVGIKHTALDDIFNRFYRTPDAINAGVTGSGLGLAIARAMIETQHGQLTVTSALGEGSTFTITLPAAPHRPS